MKKCITTIYYLVDNFCKEYEKWEKSKLLPSEKQRNRDGQLSLSELLVVSLSYNLCKLQKSIVGNTIKK